MQLLILAERSRIKLSWGNVLELEVENAFYLCETSINQNMNCYLKSSFKRREHLPRIHIFIVIFKFLKLVLELLIKMGKI